MKKICVLADTHSFFDERIKGHLAGCDEIWHAGDIGNESLLDEMEKIAPVRAVFGNIDSHKVRIMVPEVQQFTIEGMRVVMIHIAGYPGKYNSKSVDLIREANPDIFICGHSHILKIIYDKQNQHLHINPGAAGKSGIHQVGTLVRFNIENKKISNMEVVEMKR
jgi:putative phosphoesterase